MNKALKNIHPDWPRIKKKNKKQVFEKIFSLSNIYKAIKSRETDPFLILGQNSAMEEKKMQQR